MSQEWMKYTFRSKHYTGKSQDLTEDLEDKDKLERHSEQGASKKERD